MQCTPGPNNTHTQKKQKQGHHHSSCSRSMSIDSSYPPPPSYKMSTPIHHNDGPSAGIFTTRGGAIRRAITTLCVCAPESIGPTIFDIPPGTTQKRRKKKSVPKRSNLCEHQAPAPFYYVTWRRTEARIANPKVLWSDCERESITEGQSPREYWADMETPFSSVCKDLRRGPERIITIKSGGQD